MATDADALWGAFQNDPVGTYRAVGEQLGSAGFPVGDPRIDEMYADTVQQKQLAAYDEAISAIVNDPANADIDPNRLHTFVAAADGDFNRALELYRADMATLTQRFSSWQPGADDAQQYTERRPDESPRDSLHRAIEEATAMSRRR